jgi:hypothetical protein
MPEQPIAIAADKVDLMPSAFLVHRPQVLTECDPAIFETNSDNRCVSVRVRSSISLPANTISSSMPFARPSGIKGVLVRLGQSRRGVSHRLLNKRGTLFGKLWHDE